MPDLTTLTETAKYLRQQGAAPSDFLVGGRLITTISQR